MVAPNVKSKTADEDKDYWATPDNIYRGALAYFKEKGLVPPQYQYGLDVCASKHNKKHNNFIDEQADSLLQDWCEYVGVHEVCWCNPPYRRGSKEQFIVKAVTEAHAGVPTIMLLPNDTSAKWFSACVREAKAIAFICNGRISFINNATGEYGHGNNAGSILVLFAPRDTMVARTLYVTKNHLEELGREED